MATSAIVSSMSTASIFHHPGSVKEEEGEEDSELCCASSLCTYQQDMFLGDGFVTASEGEEEEEEEDGKFVPAVTCDGGGELVEEVESTTKLALKFTISEVQ